MRTHKSLIGQRFGKLVIIDEVRNKDNNLFYCKCKCDCGNEIITRQSSLTDKSTNSCGCLQKANGRKMGLSNRKFENKCKICGAEKHYAKGYCRSCYLKQKRKEEKENG